ncbi:unnamed protein product, partial [Allacma fusca]
VGKEHLDLKVGRSRKRLNGVKGAEIPSAIFTSTSETRSPSSVRNASEAHQDKCGHEQDPKNSKASMSASIDEIDARGAPIVQQIKITKTKPQVTPRGKTKGSNVKAGHKSIPSPVEAISPVIQMSYDTNVTGDFSLPNPNASAVLEVQPVEVNVGKPNMSVESDVSGKSMTIQSPDPKAPHVQIDIGLPTVSLDSPVKKPEREKHKGEKGSGDKTKGKFGMHVPDISLNFGGKGGTDDTADDKSKKGKKGSKEELELNLAAKLPSFEPAQVKRKKSSEIGMDQIDLNVSIPKPQLTGAVDVNLEGSSVKIDEDLQMRPPSTDSAKGRKSGFHMPSLGIKLPKFSSSKQTYSFGNDADPNAPSASASVELPGASLEMPSVDAQGPEVKVNIPKVPKKKGKAPSVSMDVKPLTLHGPDVQIKGGIPKADLKSGDINVRLPEVSVEGQVPDMNISGEIPDPSLKVKGQGFKLPSLFKKSNKKDLSGDLEFEAPDMNLSMEGDIKMPDVSVEGKAPKIKVKKGKAPDISLKGKVPDVNIKGPKISGDLNIDGQPLSLESEEL